MPHPLQPWQRKLRGRVLAFWSTHDWTWFPTTSGAADLAECKHCGLRMRHKPRPGRGPRQFFFLDGMWRERTRRPPCQEGASTQAIHFADPEGMPRGSFRIHCFKATATDVPLGPPTEVWLGRGDTVRVSRDARVVTCQLCLLSPAFLEV